MNQSNDDESFKEEAKLLDQLEYEDSKRFFSAAVLQQKYNQYEYSLKGGITISELFQKCWDRKIPRTQWKDFIQG
eukprot:CAMPEP_0170555308 /NCGR_PEP_ID=MMETSP0211-20121228/13219_1 /TAXON_ID=311385 /ORGANISM="Pseudokeronopsis sp., Strain OXSARD2" /LENGTH=74 /DNA_ID=CAMNT_0010865069 /DNA_START=398 /DNA_END=619 /DNA_ORIENTATION=+